MRILTISPLQIAAIIGAMLAWASIGAVAEDLNRADSFTQDSSLNATAMRGIDQDGVDFATDPGADFYRYANGRWHDTARIEDGDWQAGTSQSVRNRVERRTSEIVRELRRDRWPGSSNEGKFLTIYNNYNNREARRQAGLRPIRPFIELIGRAETHDDVASLLGSYNLDAGGLFKVALRLDPIQGAGYVASIEPADLLLQSQALYLRQDSLAIDQRNESRRLLARLLRRVGRNSRAESRVDAVFELEHRLAELYPEPVAARQPIIAENVFGIASLETTFPEFPWRRFLAARGVVKDTIIQVPPRDQIPELIALFHATPVSVWRDYMTLRLILSYGSYLDEGTDRLVAEFDAARSGIAYTPLKRRERAWRVAADILPDPIGRAYVEQYLTDTTVVEVHKIVDWTLLAYRERIEAADWLEAETRRRAIEKLDAITVVVGEPPGWNNFDFFTPIRGSLFSNAYSRQQLRHRSALARLLSSTEDEEDPSTPSKNPLDDIFFSPISVGAYYLPTLNSIVVPAAYLQAPYYDPSASLAVNFGALGTTIGHELGHAFDDQGARRGPDGQITDWWSAKDNEQFVAKGDKLSRHLSAFEAAPGIPLNTALTLGENLSDLVGVEIAFRAMELAHHAGGGEGVAKEDAQAFFISYAQKRRAKRLPTIEIDFAYSNLHSPPSVRVNGILPHVDQWYSAFDVSEDDPLWVAPEDRVRIW